MGNGQIKNFPNILELKKEKKKQQILKTNINVTKTLHTEKQDLLWSALFDASLTGFFHAFMQKVSYN